MSRLTLLYVRFLLWCCALFSSWSRRLIGHILALDESTWSIPARTHLKLQASVRDQEAAFGVLEDAKRRM